LEKIRQTKDSRQKTKDKRQKSKKIKIKTQDLPSFETPPLLSLREGAGGVSS